MIRTRVGYTGGRRPSPTYDDLGDHTEAVQVDYDPAVISYEELLALFWASHQPSYEPLSPQYKAAVWYHDAEQREIAETSLGRLARRLGEPVVTEVFPVGPFERAEDHHQKWYLRRQEEIAAELLAAYPDPIAFTDSTAATKLNGFIGAPGDAAQLEAIVDELGLSERSRERALALAGG